MKDIVYISDKLHEKFEQFEQNLRTILKKNGNQIKTIKDTEDIWCRDYMPVIGSNGEMIRFKYQPSYLTDSKSNKGTITNVDKILNETYTIDKGIKRKRWGYLKTDIKLDGGAIEVYEDQAIISDRVFRENKGDEVELLTKIKRLLGLNEITVIPQHPYDFTGHVDGLVRFIDSDTVLINDLSSELKAAQNDKNQYRKRLLEQWVYSFRMALYNAGYKMEELPYRAHNNKGDDAKGIYTNFLKLSDLIIMPTFTFKKEDEEAKKKLEQLYPGRKVETIYASDLAKKGGIVNCVTWNK